MIKSFEFQNAIRQSNFPADFINFANEEYKPLTDEQKAVQEAILKLIEGKVRTLTLLGRKGCGKTYAGCSALTQYLFENYWLTNKSVTSVVRYTKHFEIDLKYKSAMSPATTYTQYDVYNEFSSYRMLCIDEIGRGQMSEYTMNLIENIIEKRYENQLPTILISNKTPQEFCKIFDNPIIDRLSNGKNGIVLDLIGESLR